MLIPDHRSAFGKLTSGWTKIALLTVVVSCGLGMFYGFFEANCWSIASFIFSNIILCFSLLYGLPLFVSRVLVLFFLRPKSTWQIFFVPLAVSIVGSWALFIARVFTGDIYFLFGLRVLLTFNALGGDITVYFLILVGLDAIALWATGSLKHKIFWAMCLMNLALIPWICTVSCMFTVCPGHPFTYKP